MNKFKVFFLVEMFFNAVSGNIGYLHTALGFYFALCHWGWNCTLVIFCILQLCIWYILYLQFCFLPWKITLLKYKLLNTSFMKCKLQNSSEHTQWKILSFSNGDLMRSGLKNSLSLSHPRECRNLYWMGVVIVQLVDSIEALRLECRTGVALSMTWIAFQFLKIYGYSCLPQINKFDQYLKKKGALYGQVSFICAECSSDEWEMTCLQQRVWVKAI